MKIYEKYEQTTGIVKKRGHPYFKRIEVFHEDTIVVELISVTEQTKRSDLFAKGEGRWGSLGLAGANYYIESG